MTAHSSMKTGMLKHIGYWVAFVLFFTFVWGTYDHGYLRNFYIQAFSLPAKLILVYVSLYYLFPRFLLKRKYLLFIISYILLLVAVSIMIQRPMMMYYIQPSYLPQWNNDNFFAISEIMNTILDVNLAAVIPCGYAFFRVWQKADQHAKNLSARKGALDESEFFYVKVEKTLQKILLKDIIFIEALKNYVKIRTIEQDIIAYRSILSMEDALPKEKFIRVHRSFIVSIEYIEKFSPNKLEINGQAIPIGRKYKEAVKKTLGYF